MNERRQERRFPMSGPAKIVIADDQPEVACIVREISAKGASLEVASEVPLPESFLVVPDDGDASGYRCSLAWRNETVVGVKFDQ
jgi:PilZ domain